MMWMRILGRAGEQVPMEWPMSLAVKLWLFWVTVDVTVAFNPHKGLGFDLRAVRLGRKGPTLDEWRKKLAAQL